MAKLNDRKYGPKVGAKDRDKTAKRYVSRRATFGTPGSKPTPAGTGYVPKPGTKPFRASHSAVTNTYTPPVTSATVRPNSTGYIKKTFTPRTPGAFSRPSSTASLPFKKSTSWSKTKMEKGKFAEKRAPYVPRAGAAKPYSPRPTQSTGGHEGKKVYSKSRDMGATKPHFKSAIPNKPRTASASWGAVASWYDKHLNEADTYHEKVILPNLLRLIDAKKGDTILDLACGQGFFARALRKAGASVTGIDIAPELIAIAKAESEDIPYHVGSAEKLSMFDNESFSKALISLSLQNIEHVEPAIKEAGRVLKSGGTIHIVMNHPAFRIPKQSEWGYDDRKKVQYRRVDQYLSNSSTAIDMHPGFSDAPQTISFHRPLQFYFKAFTKAGFAVTRLEEWISHKDSDSGPRASAENTARKEIPLFLYLKVEKL